MPSTQMIVEYKSCRNVQLDGRRNCYRTSETGNVTAQDLGKYRLSDLVGIHWQRTATIHPSTKSTSIADGIIKRNLSLAMAAPVHFLLLS
jgi:hypothetical protein